MKNIQWRKESSFNKWCWEKWTASCKRMKCTLLSQYKLPMKDNFEMWVMDIFRTCFSDNRRCLHRFQSDLPLSSSMKLLSYHFLQWQPFNNESVCLMVIGNARHKMNNPLFLDIILKMPMSRRGLEAITTKDFLNSNTVWLKEAPFFLGWSRKPMS